MRTAKIQGRQRRWSIQSALRTGPSTSVWSAYDDETGEKAAVKIFESCSRDHFVQSPAFPDEVSVINRLPHRYVARVLDDGQTLSGQNFIVTEYLSGGTLKDRIDQVGHLSLTEAEMVISDIARALSDVHLNGVSHHDIKPFQRWIYRQWRPETD